MHKAVDIRVDGTKNYLWQWDIGRRLKLEGVEVGTQVHFSYESYNDEDALVVESFEEDEAVYAEVPNILLQSSGQLKVYLYVNDIDEKYTKIRQIINVFRRPKPADYVYTQTEVLSYKTLDTRMKALEDDLENQVAESVETYLKENPIEGVKFETDDTLTLEDGVLSVNTTNDMEADNTLPITAAGVFAVVGNIEALLGTI